MVIAFILFISNLRVKLILGPKTLKVPKNEKAVTSFVISFSKKQRVVERFFRETKGTRTVLMKEKYD